MTQIIILGICTASAIISVLAFRSLVSGLITVAVAFTMCYLVKTLSARLQKFNGEKNKKHSAWAVVEIETAHNISMNLSKCNTAPKSIALQAKDRTVKVVLEGRITDSANLRSLRRVCDIPINWKIFASKGNVIITVEMQERIYGSRRAFKRTVLNEIRTRHPEWEINGNSIRL